MFDHRPERDRVEPLTRPSATLSPSDGERDGVRGFRRFASHAVAEIQFHKIPARDRHAARLGIIQRRTAYVCAEDFVITGPALPELKQKRARRTTYVQHRAARTEFAEQPQLA